MSEDVFEHWLMSDATKAPPSLFRYLDVIGTQGTLRSGQLWCSCPLGFNDPLDNQWDLYWQFGTTDFRDKRARAIADLILGATDLSEIKYQKYREFLERQRASLFDIPRHLRFSHLSAQDYGEIETPPDVVTQQRRMTETFRILCVCESPQIPRMWARYASEYAGAVLQFDTPSLCRAWRSPVYPASYLPDERPPLVFEDTDELAKAISRLEFPRPDIEVAARNIAVAKTSKWTYEREWRFLFRDPTGPSPLKLQFPAEALQGVAFGDDFPSSARDDLSLFLTTHYPAATISTAFNRDAEGNER